MSKIALEKFGEKVREERLKLDLPQGQQAFKADVHRTYIGMIERVEKNIALENVDEVFKADNYL